MTLGDFNIQFLTCNKLSDFKNICNSYGFVITIRENTRLNSCLDNIIINFSLEECNIGVV